MARSLYIVPIYILRSWVVRSEDGMMLERPNIHIAM